MGCEPIRYVPHARADQVHDEDLGAMLERIMDGDDEGELGRGGDHDGFSDSNFTEAVLHLARAVAIGDGAAKGTKAVAAADVVRFSLDVRGGLDAEHGTDIAARSGDRHMVHGQGATRRKRFRLPGDAVAEPNVGEVEVAVEATSASGQPSAEGQPHPEQQPLPTQKRRRLWGKQTVG